MIRLDLKEIATALDLDAPVADVTIDRIVTDSRKVRHGALFAALAGQRVDGHDYAESAVGLGAAALLVQRQLDLDIPQLVADDVLMALGRIARHVCEKANPRVVAITGSNGKTTVKEMVSCILGQSSELLATSGNFNNELGLPLTLFELESSHEFAVLEMGASRRGDIEYLASIARPEVALITNIGPAHLEGFGDMAGVADAKGEIYEQLIPSGCAVINADEPYGDDWLARSQGNESLTFGLDDTSDIRLLEDGSLDTPAGVLQFDLKLPGLHNRINAAAATAVAIALGIHPDQIVAGLNSVSPVPGRLNTLKTAAGWTVVDDTYNANPASLYSALQVLSGLQGKAWLVLGDMKELGENSRKLHAEVGEAARSMGVRKVFATGEDSLATVDAFGDGAFHFESREELIGALADALRPGINCLVKGSRSMGMEHVVNALVAMGEHEKQSRRVAG